MVFEVFQVRSKITHFGFFQAVIALTSPKIELESCIDHIIEALSLSFHYLTMASH